MPPVASAQLSISADNFLGRIVGGELDFPVLEPTASQSQDLACSSSSLQERAGNYLKNTSPNQRSWVEKGLANGNLINPLQNVLKIALNQANNKISSRQNLQLLASASIFIKKSEQSNKPIVYGECTINGEEYEFLIAWEDLRDMQSQSQNNSELKQFPPAVVPQPNSSVNGAELTSNNFSITDPQRGVSDQSVNRVRTPSLPDSGAQHNINPHATTSSITPQPIPSDVPPVASQSTDGETQDLSSTKPQGIFAGLMAKLPSFKRKDSKPEDSPSQSGSKTKLKKNSKQQRNKSKALDSGAISTPNLPQTPTVSLTETAVLNSSPKTSAPLKPTKPLNRNQAATVIANANTILQARRDELKKKGDELSKKQTHKPPMDAALQEDRFGRLSLFRDLTN